MTPQIGKNMPKKAVKKIKSKQEKEKQKMRIKNIAMEIKQSKQVPGLLQCLDTVCFNNFQEWLVAFPNSLPSMSENKVRFGLTVQKFGMLDASLTGAMQNRLQQLELEKKTLAQTAEAQGDEAVISPPRTLSVKSNLLLPKTFQCHKPWQTLLDFLLHESLEKMGVTLVDRALKLLELGFAKSVVPTINPEPTMQGNLQEHIRNKLRTQQALARAKNAENTEKKHRNQLILKEYTKNLGCKIDWTKDCRPVAFTGLVVSPDPNVIFAPFSLSKQELTDLLNNAKRDAMETPLLPIHQAVLTVYTGSHYAKLNLVLRTPGNEAEFQKYAHYLFHLTNALSLLEKLPKSQTTVHRGTAFFELNIKPGDTLVFQAPTSASKCMHTANEFSGSNGIHFVIEPLTAKSIEKFSVVQEEEEVLFPPNSHFTVEKITGDKHEMAKLLSKLKDENIQDIRTMVVLKQYA